MISKEELKKVAELKGLSIQNAEKDYFLDLLLYSIYKNFSDELILKGGTALYKFYKLNRFSEDLDFTLNRKRFDEENFLKKISFNLTLLDFKFLKEVERFKNEINLRFKFFGPLYDGKKESLCTIVLNVSLREKIVLKPRMMLLVSKYQEIPSCNCFVLDEKEILAEKVRAVLTRNKARDVYDIWFLLKKGVEVDLKIVKKKLKIYNLEFSLSQFQKSIEEKKSFWEKELTGLIVGSVPTFEEVEKEIIEKFKSFV